MKAPKMKTHWLLTLLPLVTQLLTTACGLAPGDVMPVEQQSYSLDGVKLISRNIRRGDDPSTMQQAQYRIDSDQRLLLRFEAFADYVSGVKTDDANKVTLEITLANGADQDAAVTGLKVCPLTHDWMMLATWTRGYPFTADGPWRTEGGDYDRQGCMSPVKTGDASLTYDVTQWFRDYPRGRQVNYGLILLTETRPFNVLGSTSGAHSPRIQWMAVPGVRLDGRVR